MKKISLEGRKRIGELGTADAVADKKAQLMAMQQEHQATPAPVAPPVSVAKVQLVHQPELPLPPAPARRELTVEFVVEQLVIMHQKLGQMGNRAVRRFTPQMQADYLVKELREVLRQKAKEGVAARLSDRNNMAACQAFIDEVSSQLAQKGIRLNSLTVVAQQS